MTRKGSVSTIIRGALRRSSGTASPPSSPPPGLSTSQSPALLPTCERLTVRVVDTSARRSLRIGCRPPRRTQRSRRSGLSYTESISRRSTPSTTGSASSLPIFCPSTASKPTSLLASDTSTLPGINRPIRRRLTYVLGPISPVSKRADLKMPLAGQIFAGLFSGGE